ncbi:helix-turn-helix domain-containing protein [Micromonospora sp. NPDC048935]|uniref:AlbA family DNA-binding domain-containing protein n=1 Tax=Micromonospora sp. NPDC048935 TaxID=3364262 RepID=UPI003716C9A6
MLRSDDDWLHFRYFPAPGPGGDTDSSVIWDLPGADARVLIAGGESQYVEFKEQLPVSEHRRKMLKTVAAFTSGKGGTVLIGVTDDSQIAGVDTTKLDELMLALHNMIRSNIDPDPEATVRPVPVDGKTVLLVEVPGGTGWHAYNREKPEFYLRTAGTMLGPAERQPDRPRVTDPSWWRSCCRGGGCAAAPSLTPSDRPKRSPFRKPCSEIRQWDLGLSSRDPYRRHRDDSQWHASMRLAS